MFLLKCSAENNDTNDLKNILDFSTNPSKKQNGLLN